jgi:hypothetical protein
MFSSAEPIADDFYTVLVVGTRKKRHMQQFYGVSLSEIVPPGSDLHHGGQITVRPVRIPPALSDGQ